MNHTKKTTCNILNTRSIPYEVRRNPINIYNFENIVYNNLGNTKKKLNRYNKMETIKEEFLYTNSNCIIPNDCKLMFKKNKTNKLPTEHIISKKVYLYKVMSLNNIGHFYIDNLIPIIKMILVDQNIFKNKIIDIERDNYIIFLNTYDETNKQQTLSNKHKEYLLPFTKHEIKFLSDYPNKTLFKNIIISTLGIGQAISFTNWNKYDNPESIDENINIKFMQTIKKIYYKFYNILENANPNKIVILSRKNAKHRKMINEKLLFDNLNQRFENVELIQFENLELKNELYLLNNVALFISSHGAGIISSFFIPELSTCIIINPKGFSFIYDFPTIYKTYLQRLNINVIQYENNSEEDIVLKTIYENRDKNFYVNIKKINEIIDENVTV